MSVHDPCSGVPVVKLDSPAICTIPDDVLLRVFEFCPDEACRSLPQVCKGWRNILQRPCRLWERVLVPRRQGHPNPDWTTRLHSWIIPRLPAVRSLELLECPTKEGELENILPKLAPHLTHLSICEHSLQSAVRAASICTALTRLDLWVNEFTPCEASSGLFRPLVATVRQLSLSGWLGRPSCVPAPLLELSGLRYLRLSLRGLTTIQSEIFQSLPCLRTLHVSHAINLLMAVTEEAGQASNLEHLIISDCNIHNIWGEITWLEDLLRLRRLERIGLGRLYSAPEDSLREMWCVLNQAPEPAGAWEAEGMGEGARLTNRLCLGSWEKQPRSPASAGSGWRWRACSDWGRDSVCSSA
eukprot:jgi/Botrbrau1/9647/Bobra.0131s0023.1